MSERFLWICGSSSLNDLVKNLKKIRKKTVFCSKTSCHCCIALSDRRGNLTRGSAGQFFTTIRMKLTRTREKNLTPRYGDRKFSSKNEDSDVGTLPADPRVSVPVLFFIKNIDFVANLSVASFFKF